MGELFGKYGMEEYGSTRLLFRRFVRASKERVGFSEFIKQFSMKPSNY